LLDIYWTLFESDQGRREGSWRPTFGLTGFYISFPMSDLYSIQSARVRGESDIRRGRKARLSRAMCNFFTARQGAGVIPPKGGTTSNVQLLHALDSKWSGR